MLLKSAFEDLSETTLAALAGVLAKLRYLAGLREQQSGTYKHWGLSHIHGDAAAQQALADAHRGIFLRLLRTPVRQLRQDLEKASAAAGMTEKDFIEDLTKRKEDLLPGDAGGGSPRHFSSVLYALSILTSRPGETPPDASRQS